MRVAAVLVCGAQVRVTVAVARFVASEVLNVIWTMMFIEMFAAMRILAMPPIIAVEVVVDMSPEMLAAVKPWSRADEDAAGKPFRAIVAIGSAFIRRIVEIAIRTHRRRTNLNRNLRK